MHIYNLLPNTFIDYPGKIAAIIFNSGCNFNCWYCHNKEIIPVHDKKITEENVLDFLKERKGFLDALVVSGGEPTLDPDLENFLKQVKSIGYLIKLDTNGTNLPLVKKLVDFKLIDYIAVDIKAPAEKYLQVCGSKMSEKDLKKIIFTIENLGIDYEFRTTFSPDLDESDILKIAHMLDKKDKYFIQQYRQNSAEGAVSHNDEFVGTVAKNVEKILPNCKVRGLLIHN